MSHTSRIESLFQTDTIRQRCRLIFDYVQRGESPYFTLDLAKLDDAAQLVIAVSQENYPDFVIPYHSRWRHFEIEGTESYTVFHNMLPSDPLLRGRCRFDTVILSVLLDAGAGSQWTYRDHATNQTFRSSEGLAIASLELLNHGFFSVDDQCHLRVDAAKILSSSYASFAKMMQHHDGNPLQAVEGRWSLLQSLAHVMNERHEIFRDPTNHENRLGLFFDYLLLLPKDNRISASIVLKEVLEVFGPIWPGRLEREGYNLGDTWLHSAIKTGDETEQLVPFHKLSQWLTYSLLEPLEDFGIQVDDIDSLTGLPEYRNGGLFLDTGVIRLKSESLRNKTLHPSDEMIVEWRALTVHLLDQVALKMRQQLQGSSQSLPLAKVLQGGTWAAGRRLAKEMRNGAPPLLIELEGTVF